MCSECLVNTAVTTGQFTILQPVHFAFPFIDPINKDARE